MDHVGDYLIVLGLAENRCVSPNACVDVFANGIYLSSINFRERLLTSEYCLLVSRCIFFGSWVELSLRPRPYLGDQASANKWWLKRSLPVQRLRVFDIEQMNEFFSGYHVPQLYLTILKGQEPQSTKFVRIKNRMANSPFQNAREFRPTSIQYCTFFRILICSSMK